MRLNENEIKSIKETFIKIFKDGEIYLFGSRADNTKKGGDIDLYIETTSDEYDYLKVLELNSKIQNEIGWQKIDIVVNQLDKKQDKFIYKNAKNTGVLLG
jgi:predicted nucleotidyltransferase